ncbi:MAG: hypothetical protein DI565_12785 [Ancylobacter novellus]|uniref:Integrase DNA-binding domain-containing protein n=1 Tax=Ancylobacter novellus TaxID=921 RepID=A0A2W5MLG6_ANCNO|nr:MAG: hypothetical protein DI565_12785 [Ancylobacter novellus]
MPDSAVIELGPAVVKQALAVAAEGYREGAWIRTDTTEKGFQLRVEGKSAKWYVRCAVKGKNHYVLLGEVLPDQSRLPEDLRRPGLQTTREARALAGEVKQRLRAGIEVTAEWIAARRLGQSTENADTAAATRAGHAAGEWTYEVLCERYVSEWVGKAKVAANGSVRPPSPEAVEDTRRYMDNEWTAHMKGRLLRDLHEGDLERARDLALATGAKSPQRKVVTYVKAAMTWAKANHGAQSGLRRAVPWWVTVNYVRMATEKHLAAAERGGQHEPITAEHAARLLHVAESNRVAPGRMVQSRTSDVVLAALWWTVLTAQRSHAAIGTRVEGVFDMIEAQGHYLVTWTPAEVKGKRWFTLPITKRVYDLTIGRALAAEDRRASSRFVFPRTTQKDRGKETHTDAPLTDSVLNTTIRRLRGLDRLERDGELVRVGEDLLEGLPHITPHKLREALATELGNTAGITPGAASSILDHATLEAKDEAEKEADVTSQFYNFSSRLHMKSEGLEIWVSRILVEYDRLEELAKAERAVAAAASKRRAIWGGGLQAAAAKLAAEAPKLPVEELPGEVDLESPSQEWFDEQHRLHEERAAREEAAAREAAEAAARKVPLSEGMKSLRQILDAPDGAGYED